MFPPEVEELYFFTQVVGAQEPVEIRHVWSYGGREMASIALPVEADSWRTWSTKQIPPDSRGDWTVEVRGPKGRVLVTATCRLE